MEVFNQHSAHTHASGITAVLCLGRHHESIVRKTEENDEEISDYRLKMMNSRERDMGEEERDESDTHKRGPGKGVVLWGF